MNVGIRVCVPAHVRVHAQLLVHVHAHVRVQVNVRVLPMFDSLGEFAEWGSS